MEFFGGKQEFKDVVRSLHVALDELAALELTPSDQKAAIALVRDVESLGTRIDSLQTSLVGVIEESGVHQIDAFTPKSFIGHHARTSKTEAGARHRTMRALRDLPSVAAAYEAAEITTEIARRIARVHANPRVRAALIEAEAEILERVRGASYAEADDLLTDWTRLVDEDGTCDRNQRSHENRNVSLLRDFDESWTLHGGFAALQGAEIETIFGHYIDLEFRIDWDQAVAEHGDLTNHSHLARTDRQRRADAFHKMCVAANTNGSGKPAVTTNIVIDEVTFARWIRKLEGTDPGADDPWRPGYRCSTVDGVRLEPGEAVAAALLGDIRRILIDAKGVVIDMGRRSRLYTGHARLAAQIPDQCCIWPGCGVKTSRCEIDHSTPWVSSSGGDPGGGCTCPDNGAPLCGRHNRHKQHGYRSARGPSGRWVLTRPDGTTVD